MNKETILKFYQNYRLYIFPATVVFSCLILIMFVIYPQVSKLITNQRIEGEVLTKSKFLEGKVQALENYDVTDLSQKVGFALSSYPTDKDFVSALGALQNLISKSDFSTTSMSLGSSSSKSTNTQSYNIRLDVFGPVIQLPVLLSNIESSPRLMRVTGLETNLGKDPKGATISLTVDVLYSSAPQAFGSVDSPLPSLSQKDEEVITKLARVRNSQPSQQTTTQLGPRGKANPFE